MSHADEQEPMLTPEEEAELLGSLRAALRPSELDPGTNERLIELCLDDAAAAPSAEELAESARLRDALSSGSPHEDADVLRALRAPFMDRVEQAALDRALAAAMSDATQPNVQLEVKRRGKVVIALFGGASALLAAAAVVALLLAPAAQRSASESREPAGLLKTRSTVDLFEQPFETGATTARIDAIAVARSRDLRDNRYTSWRVR